MSGVTRLEKVGTIFARLNAMLKKGVLPESEKPIWYEIYALHPPYYEPRYDHIGPEDEIREILYEDDLIRAKYHAQLKFHPVINLNDQNAETETKKFINLYKSYKAQGALHDEQIFEVALEQLNKSRKQNDVEHEIDSELDEEQHTTDFGLIENFTESIEKRNKKPSSEKENKMKEPGFDVKNLF